MAELTWEFNFDAFERNISMQIFDGTEEQVTVLGKRIAARTKQLIEQRAQRTTPGGLADSVRGSVDSDNAGLTWDVIVTSDMEHAIWFEKGTGVFGPRNAFITAPSGGAMVWYDRHFISRKIVAFKVEGQPGKHPFEDAFKETQIRFTLGQIKFK